MATLGTVSSHVVEELLASGREVVVLDDFSAGLAQRLVPGVPVVTASVLDRAAVDRQAHAPIGGEPLHVDHASHTLHEPGEHEDPWRNRYWMRARMRTSSPT